MNPMGMATISLASSCVLFEVPKVAASKGATMMAQNATMAAAHSLYILQPQGAKKTLVGWCLYRG